MHQGNQIILNTEVDDTLCSAAEDRVPTKSFAKGSALVEVSSLSSQEIEQLTFDIVAAIKTVYDPEIPCDIYELGLIYKIDIDDDRQVKVEMTLTAPGCPVSGDMPVWVENVINTVPGVNRTIVKLTFDPPWDISMMSDEARLELNMF
ncbi:MAG: SUF system Fe-S cluster assembly protein [Hyphomicrobiaceae bacterium]|nr:SUF system Fe-S cluster assembly protein [Hyphomicrobiaceae bacterium]